MQAEPIGYFRSEQNEKYLIPHQSNVNIENEGTIILNPRCQFEQALEGLEGFDRIWVVFWFHCNTKWKPKVYPPRGDRKRGVFATRSPHRPNFIGLSCVELVSIKGLKLEIKNHDLLDGTPILDLKPYLNYADSFTCKRQGWLDEIDETTPFTIDWTAKARQQLSYLKDNGIIDLKGIETRLKLNPFPRANHRIKKLDDALFMIAYKSWRLTYQVQDKIVLILNIWSGYDSDSLEGRKPSRWEDIDSHRAFIDEFRTYDKE